MSVYNSYLFQTTQFYYWTEEVDNKTFVKFDLGNPLPEKAKV